MKTLDEYDTVKTAVGIFDFSIEGKIKILGPERINFIDGIVSNDIKNLEEQNGIYAAFLDKLGKVLSDCIIYKFKDFLLINLSLIGKNNIIKKLIDDAKLVDSIIKDVSMKYALFSLQGPKSIELIKKIFKSNLELKNQYQTTIKNITLNNNNIEYKNNSADEIEVIITKNTRTTEDGYDIYVPAPNYKEFKEIILETGKQFGLKIINYGTYDALRLEAKKPLFGIDFNNKNILPEITEQATSFEKGCFVGQEIVARVKNLAKGLTAKKLVSLEIDTTEIPLKEDKIMKDGKEIGFITSAAFSPTLSKVVAFGFVNKGFYDIGSELEVGDKRNKSVIT